MTDYICNRSCKFTVELKKFLLPSDIIPVIAAVQWGVLLTICGDVGVNNPTAVPVIQKCQHTIMCNA
jgi:hypothetical protein